MKRTILLLAAVTMILTACAKDDNGWSRTPHEVRAALQARYPDALGVEWESRGGYYVAEFTIPGSIETTDNKAWFDRTGTWYMTEFDIPYRSLPENVRAALKDSEWGRWEIDDVDKIERDGLETLYVVEFEGRNAQGMEQDLVLYFSPDGLLVKQVDNQDARSDYADLLPASYTSLVQQFIEQRYPKARILDMDNERNGIEVEILDGPKHRELYFDVAGNWKRTETELTSAELPQAVCDAFANSDYARYGIEEAYLIEKHDLTYYLLETEVDDRDIYLYYDTNSFPVTIA